MTGTIKVSPDKLLSTSAEFSSQGNTIISLTGEMMNIVASMSSVWEGEAASSYMTKFKSLESDIQTLNRMIQEHVNDLEQTFIQPPNSRMLMTPLLFRRVLFPDK